MQDILNGGKADHIDYTDLAKKYHVPLNYILDQLEKGTKVEMEHTDQAYIAQEIARDHLSEDLNYYTKLRAMEKTAGVMIRMPEELKKDTELLESNLYLGEKFNPNEAFIYTGSYDNYCRMSFRYILKMFEVYKTLGKFEAISEEEKSLNNTMFNVLSHSQAATACITSIENIYREQNENTHASSRVVDFFVWTGIIGEGEVEPEQEDLEGGELTPTQAPLNYKLHCNNNTKKEGSNMDIEVMAKEAVWGKVAEASDLKIKVTMLNEAIEGAENISELSKIRGDIENEVQVGMFNKKDEDPEVNRIYMNVIALLNTKADELRQDPPTPIENLTAEASMKINSNTYVIVKEAEEFKTLEGILTKIAQDNSISNIEKINITASESEMFIQFKEASECSGDITNIDNNTDDENNTTGEVDSKTAAKKNDDKKKDKKDDDKESDKKDKKKDDKKKEARNPQLEQKLYQGALNRTELEELQKVLQEDIKAAQPGSATHKQIQEELQMIQGQLSAEDGLDRIRSDSYSFAE